MSWMATTERYSRTGKLGPGNRTRTDYLSQYVRRDAETTLDDSMMGPNIDDVDLKGIIPRIAERAFDAIMNSAANLEYLVKVSYMEIYMERIR